MDQLCELYVKLLMYYPAVVKACNVDLETLITDSNRSIATLAITTLLKVFFYFSFLYLMIWIFRREMRLVLIDYKQ
jgi:hypothetical protein